MTPSRDETPLHSPRSSVDASSVYAKRASSPSAASISSSISSLPYRRSNATLSSLFASTSTLRPSSPTSGTGTPQAPIIAGSVFSPPRNGASSPASSSSSIGDELRSLILRSFVPHVGILASTDTEEICRQKGFAGGFLELMRPYGEQIQGKVTVRDSVGASRSWEDFGIRFTGLKDALGVRPRLSNDVEPGNPRMDPRGEPASFLRVGGDLPAIEEAVDKHLFFAEMQMGSAADDYFNSKRASLESPGSSSPFYRLYLRRLLSGLPMTPHETFSHPVACVIAISSRNPNPIEELRRLYSSTNSGGDQKLPPWVNNDYLRYYVLVHDEDNDDIGKSTALYDQMKRHFGLHCHLLRLRSSQCVSSDDDAARLPLCEWLSASEELAEIQKRETSEELEDPTPCLFESDATAIRTFVRELVTQSIVPTMERLAMTWNEQVASRRKGISGRFMSLSKRWSTFGSSSRGSGNPLQGGSGSNYDSLQGFYRPDTAEAIMRKLADYAFMLRDFRLASSTYDILRTDYNNDKAWKYYAGANEMTVVSSLLVPHSMSSKTRVENVDQMLETAHYSYYTRCGSPYHALRSLALGLELLKLRGSSASDDAARWAQRILESPGIVGPIGRTLFTERTSDCYAGMRGVGSMSWGVRRRKAGLWAVQAADLWLRLDRGVQAEKCLDAASVLYGLTSETAEPAASSKDDDDGKQLQHLPHQRHGAVLEFDQMRAFMDTLRQAVVTSRLAARGFMTDGDATTQADGTADAAVNLDAAEGDAAAAAAAAAPGTTASTTSTTTTTPNALFAPSTATTPSAAAAAAAAGTAGLLPADEPVEEVAETMDQKRHGHRKSLIGGVVVPPLAGDDNAGGVMRSKESREQGARDFEGQGVSVGGGYEDQVGELDEGGSVEEKGKEG
ncbi:ER-golgi trafficking TRAPP I complex 85 kDa subunit-domain-containing protein [Phyllosticta citriasiana]|uniref:ER-golgi trafficking TRAPP I complex 85 kDa subunit-domain-containing protein n=1 Tax=Phyllosticta citriasiana TaxID=595635 RepID=A0ABR1KDQ2_9PEZI